MHEHLREYAITLRSLYGRDRYDRFGPPLPTPAVHKFVNYLNYWRRAGSNGADADGTTMELTSVESSIWYSGHAEASVARRFTHKNIVAPNYALRFWTKLEAMLLAPFNIEETIGLDGISIEVDCRTLAGSANFEVWSPEPETHAGRLVGLIYDIAWEASSVASAVERLEHLHGYLRDELPARIIDGPITRLRIILFPCRRS